MGTFLRAIIATGSDFYKDGWGLLGIFAPVISITGALFKLFGAAPMSGISWGWLFLPLAAWFLAAYVRRRNAHVKMIAASNANNCDMPLAKVVERQIGSLDDVNGDNMSELGNLFQAIRDRARLEKLSVWGREAVMQGSETLRPLSLIPAEYWHNFEISMLNYIVYDKGLTDKISGSLNNDWYRDLWFCRAQIEREFPEQKKRRNVTRQAS